MIQVYSGKSASPRYSQAGKNIQLSPCHHVCECVSQNAETWFKCTLNQHPIIWRKQVKSFKETGWHMINDNATSQTASYCGTNSTSQMLNNMLATSHLWLSMLAGMSMAILLINYWGVQWPPTLMTPHIVVVSAELYCVQRTMEYIRTKPITDDRKNCIKNAGLCHFGNATAWNSGWQTINMISNKRLNNTLPKASYGIL